MEYQSPMARTTQTIHKPQGWILKIFSKWKKQDTYKSIVFSFIWNSRTGEMSERKQAGVLGGMGEGAVDCRAAWENFGGNGNVLLLGEGDYVSICFVKIRWTVNLNKHFMSVCKVYL